MTVSEDGQVVTITLLRSQPLATVSGGYDRSAIISS